MRFKKTIIFFSFCFLLSLLFYISLAESAQDARKELSLHYYRGVVNFEAANYENALTEFQLVAGIDPAYKETRQYIKNSMGFLEQRRQQMLAVDGESSLTQQGFDYYFLGKSYYEKGQYQKALEAFQAVLDKNPNDKFALYYTQLCKDALPGRGAGAKKPGWAWWSWGRSSSKGSGDNVGVLEQEVSYVKNDIKDEQEARELFEKRVERRSERDVLIRAKEKELKEEEEVLEEEKQDYLSQVKLSKRTDKLKAETEKWRNMKERLSSKEPGVPSDMTDFPIYLGKAQKYYAAMKEALRESRWNAAGLNAISASITYGDALLIYFYQIRSAYPGHDNIYALLGQYVKRSDTEENIFNLRSMFNMKKLVEKDDRPITRSEAIFLSDKAEKIIEWCRSLLP